MLTALEPILWVNNIERSVAYYREKLGFDLRMAINGTDGAMVHAAVANGAVALMLGYKDGVPADPARSGGGAELYINTDGVDALYRHVRHAGTPLTNEIADQYWGDRTFTVTDPDGYVLTFAQPVRAFAPEESGPTMAVPA